MTEEIDERSQMGSRGGGRIEALVDILYGKSIPASTKNRLVQKVVRQLLESYGFDRADIKVGYRRTTAGKPQKSVEIAILRHGLEPREENVERVVACQPHNVAMAAVGGEELVFDDEARAGRRGPVEDRLVAATTHRRRTSYRGGVLPQVCCGQQEGTVREKVIPNAWLEKEGRRLDCGALSVWCDRSEAAVNSLQHVKQPLKTVTRGGLAGIFDRAAFSRAYVSHAEHGVPFLGSTDILDADLQFLPFLSKKQVLGEPGLLLDEGWTLITCSGTIGRMAYARSEMRGMAGSQHFMRVVPDVDVIRPGYLFAYLSSRFGLPLIVGGTYGAIIRHIEPQHIADLPVPMAPDVIQDAAHKLIEEAANLRTKASAELRAVTRDIEERAGLPRWKVGIAEKSQTFRSLMRMASAREWMDCSTAGITTPCSNHY